MEDNCRTCRKKDKGLCRFPTYLEPCMFRLGDLCLFWEWRKTQIPWAGCREQFTSIPCLHGELVLESCLADSKTHGCSNLFYSMAQYLHGTSTICLSCLDHLHVPGCYLMFFVRNKDKKGSLYVFASSPVLSPDSFWSQLAAPVDA